MWIHWSRYRPKVIELFKNLLQSRTHPGIFVPSACDVLPFILLEGILSFRGLLSATGPQFVVRSPGREHFHDCPELKGHWWNIFSGKKFLLWSICSSNCFPATCWSLEVGCFLFISRFHHVGWNHQKDNRVYGWMGPLSKVGGMIFAGGSAVLAVCTSNLRSNKSSSPQLDLMFFGGFVTNEIASKRLKSFEKYKKVSNKIH